MSADVKDEKINYIITENKSGRVAYKVKSVVDATGDCDIAHFSGVPTELFKQGNVLAAWYYSVGKDGYNLNMVGFLTFLMKKKAREEIESHLLQEGFQDWMERNYQSKHICRINLHMQIF